MGGAVSNEASLKMWKIKDSLPLTKPRPRVYIQENIRKILMFDQVEAVSVFIGNL